MRSVKTVPCRTQEWDFCYNPYSVPTIKNMLESTSVFRRQFVGQIGHPDEKDKLSFTSLTRQVDTGLKQGYSEQEIVDGVVRAISAGMVLRSYVETFKDLQYL